ncbi:oligosaccharide flippase family protein [Candidatus Micrarchaeota archaeon]|nr:oligosaccharide flippase family protein [Candidatus Micrarchaeota archaeon]
MSYSKKILDILSFSTIIRYLNIILSLGSLIIFLYFVEKQEYGLLCVALSFIPVFSTFFNFGLGGVLKPEILRSKAKEDTADWKCLLSQYSLLQIIGGILFSIILLSLYDLFLGNYPSNLIEMVKPLSLLVIINALKRIFQLVLYINLRLKLYVFVDFLELVLKLVLFFVFFIFLGPFQALILVNIVPQAISVLITGFFTLGTIFSSFQFLSFKMTKLCEITKKFGLYSFLNNLVIANTEQVPIWIINYLLGAEAVAIFSLANRIKNSVNTLYTQISTAFIPYISSEIEKNKKLAGKLYLAMIKTSSIFSFSVTIFSIIFVYFFLTSIFPKYTESIIPFLFLSPGLFFAGIAVGQKGIFYLIRGLKQILISNLLRLVLLIIMGWVLTGIWGLIGMCITISILSLIVFLNIFLIGKIEKEFDYEMVDFLKITEDEKKAIKKNIELFIVGSKKKIGNI